MVREYALESLDGDIIMLEYQTRLGFVIQDIQPGSQWTCLALSLQPVHIGAKAMDGDDVGIKEIYGGGIVNT